MAAIFAGSCVCVPSVLAHVLEWGCGGTGSCVTRVPQDCGRLQVPLPLLQEDVWDLGHPDLVSKLFPSFFLIPEWDWSLLLHLSAAFLGSAWGCSRTSGHCTLLPVRIRSPSAHPGHLLHLQLHPQPFPGVKTAAQSKRMLRGLPGTWDGDKPWGSSSCPLPAELLNPISKLYLPIESPVGIAELGKGWNSCSSPASQPVGFP